MRTGGTFNQTSTASPVQQHSPWHSPVPYLFGGLAAMLGLIAFALLILACSYWKLSGYLDSGEGGAGDNRDVESGNEDNLKAPQNYEEKILVIMAGEMKPTFLATPMSSRASSFGDNSSKSEKSEKSEEVTETPKQENGDQVQNGNMETHETSDQVH